MKRVLIALLFCVTVSGVLAAEEASPAPIRQYELGSQMFTFRAGPVLPAFFYRPNLTEGDQFLSFFDTRLHVGGYGSIRYQRFLNGTLALGGELGYFFAYDRSNLYTTVPLQAKLTYIPLQGTFEIPLSVGLGFAYNSYLESSYLSLFASAEAGFSWYFREDWGITLGAGFQFIPELYGADDDNYEHTTLAGFIPITISVTYRN